MTIFRRGRPHALISSSVYLSDVLLASLGVSRFLDDRLGVTLKRCRHGKLALMKKIDASEGRVISRRRTEKWSSLHQSEQSKTSIHVLITIAIYTYKTYKTYLSITAPLSFVLVNFFFSLYFFQFVIFRAWIFFFFFFFFFCFFIFLFCRLCNSMIQYFPVVC